jgi:hypothetical protein
MLPPSAKGISIVSTTRNAWTASVSAATVSSLWAPLASTLTNAPRTLADPIPSAPIYLAAIVANARPVSSVNPRPPRAKVNGLSMNYSNDALNNKGKREGERVTGCS